MLVMVTDSGDGKGSSSLVSESLAFSFPPSILKLKNTDQKTNPMSVWTVRQFTILIIRVTKSLDLNRFASDLDSKELIRKYRKSNTCLGFWMTA
jgi:hypothetical protein